MHLWAQSTDPRSQQIGSIRHRWNGPLLTGPYGSARVDTGTQASIHTSSIELEPGRRGVLA
jgi:hypothetical protein